MPSPSEFPSMDKVEDYIINNIALFSKAINGLPTFVTYKPWPQNLDAMIGFQVVSYSTVGWAWLGNYDENNERVIEIDLSCQVEFFAVRGRPMSTLMGLDVALKSFQDLKNEMLYYKGISFLDITNASPANTVYDGVDTEQRARSIATFGVRLSTSDLKEIEPLEHLNLTITNYTADKGESFETDLEVNDHII